MHISPLLAAALLAAAPAAAAPDGGSDWAFAKVGQTCHVFTTRAARDTSGALVFSFGQGGINAGFAYEYAPWPDETGAPWDPDDTVVLEVDGQETWLGEEMFPGEGLHGYRADLTTGFVAEMVSALMSADTSVSVNFDRAAHGELWLYGKFSTHGFSATLEQAAKQCGFDPQNLPGA